MSPCSHHTSGRLQEINDDEKKTNQGAREVQEQVENGEQVVDPDNSISVLSTVLNTINNECDHQCRDEAVSRLNAYPIRQ
jgi:hypothetical protein